MPEHLRFEDQRHVIWLRDTPEFKALALLEVRCFSLYGVAGSDKTIMASSLVDHFSSESAKRDYALAYLYCDASDRESLKSEVVLRALRVLLGAGADCSIQDINYATALDLYKWVDGHGILKTFEEMVKPKRPLPTSSVFILGKAGGNAMNVRQPMRFNLSEDAGCATTKDVMNVARIPQSRQVSPRWLGQSTKAASIEPVYVSKLN